jgi:superfamily I DNA/RNA helicase
MKDRLIVNGLDKMGCEAKGIHSMGYGAVINAFGKLEPHNFAVRDKIEAELEGDWREMKLTKGMPELLTAVEELVSKCKQTLNEPTEENLDKLADHYDIERGDDWARVCELVPKILDRCKNPVGRISFDDQVYLPVVLNLPIFKTDIGMVDEEQDLNRMQQELVYRSAYRIIGVGDEHQAIYGFAGADTESMNRVAKHLSNTDRGMVSLPLTVTRRCGKAIVQEAKRYVPEFEAHESNPLGIVREASYTHRGKGADRIEVEWDKTYCKDVGLNDLVICRINAPLVSQCFKFLRRNIPANILGRKIGDGLISLVEKSGVDRTDKLVGWLDDWLNKELALENAKKYPSDARLIAVQDKHDCLLCFAEDCNYSHEVINKIKEMFTDKAGKCIRLSSIHKAKGLESQKVFFLKPDGTQFTKRNQQPWERQQADNLEYVGITRAIEELVYVY